jgi:hypothetical protein
MKTSQKRTACLQLYAELRENCRRHWDLAARTCCIFLTTVGDAYYISEKWTRFLAHSQATIVNGGVSPSEMPRLSGTVTLGQQGKGGEPSLPVQRVSLT